MLRAGILTKFILNFPLTFTGLICIAILSCCVGTSIAQPAVTIRVDTVSVSPDAATVIIPVWLDNPSDTLAGFELWLRLNKPDMVMFEPTVDTLVDTLYWNCLIGTWPSCKDSILVTDTIGGYDFVSESLIEVIVGTYDSSGALISGWEFVDGRSLGGNGFDVKISGLSNMPSPPFTTGIGPQSGGLLVNLVARVLPIPDTLSNRVVEVIAENFPGNTSFSDQLGTSLSFQLVNGSVTILPRGCCLTPGDANHDGSFNIADVTFGIARIFTSGSAPVCGDEADANGDNSFNIADVTLGIARIFSAGVAPVCGTTGF